MERKDHLARDHLGDVPAFLEVAEARSFRAAAERLGMTPAAVSKAIGRLEERLGTRLFARTTRRVELTAAGEAFRLRAAAAIGALEDGVFAVSLAGQAAGRVRVAAPDWLVGALGEVLPGVTARFPGVEIGLRREESPRDFTRQGTDIAVRLAPGPPGQFVHTALADTVWVTVAAPGYLARAGVPERPEALARHACLRLAGPDGGRVPWQFADGPADPPARFLADDTGGVLAAAVAGHGIAQVLSPVAAPLVRSGRLAAVLEDAAAGAGPLVAVTLPGQDIVGRIAVVIAALRAWAAGQ